MKPTLKADGIKRLKLNYDELLSSVAFNFISRRYKKVEEEDNFADLVNTNSTVEVVAQGDANMRTLKVGGAAGSTHETRVDSTAPGTMLFKL